MMKTFLKLGAVFSIMCFQLLAETNRYNVLFIAVDDLRPELGCYGVEHAQSPYLDEFAKESVLFDRHYVQVPTCGASRYALLTGRSPLNSKALGNGVSSKLLPNYTEAAQTLPEVFKRSGYKTACIGKISHQPDGRIFSYNGKGDGRAELPNAWDELPTPFGEWKRGWGAFFAYAGGRHREDQKNNKDLMEFVVEKDTDLPDGLLADAAIEQLKKWRAEPFFIGLGFYKPHLPFVAPKQDWEAFENVSIPDPQDTSKPEVGHHGSGEFYKYNAPFPKDKPLKSEYLTQSRRAYLACVRYVDRQIGKVLKSLKESGLEKNTIVIVWGDNGWFLGDRQMWGKHSVLEEANRSVMMIKVPGVKPHKTSALMETVDIFPTLLDYCNPKDKALRFPLDGVSQKEVITGTKPFVRKHAVSFWGKSQSIRSDTHRLILNDKNDKAYLYEISEDGTASKNIALDKPKLVEELSKAINR